MSGVGFVVLMRWYWWRINAWSEIAAMFSSLLMFYLMNKTHFFHVIFGAISVPLYWLDEYPVRFTLNLLLTTVFWIFVTFLTDPESEKHLVKFYLRVRPGGWWGHIPEKAGNVSHLKVGRIEWLCWAVGVTGLFAMIGCLGMACLGEYFYSFLCFIYAVIATKFLFIFIGKMDWSSINDSDESACKV